MVKKAAQRLRVTAFWHPLRMIPRNLEPNFMTIYKGDIHSHDSSCSRHRKRESEWRPGDVVGGGMGFNTLGPEGISSLGPDNNGVNNGNIALEDLPGDQQL